MTCLEKRLCKTVIFFILPFFLVSCGSSKSFKTASENKEAGILDRTKISRLESELKDIRQDQANFKLQMEDKDKTIQLLRDDVILLEKKLSLLEKKNKAATPVESQIKDADPTLVYKKARNLLIEGDYQNAATLFETFIQHYPQNSLADNAAYWLGECHYSSGDYKKAIGVFKNLVTQYPKSEKIPDALLKTGYSYLSLNDSNRAHHFLKQVLKEHPFSQAAEKAQEKLGDFE